MIRIDQVDYEMKQDKAVQFLENFNSIILKGGDQTSFGLPHFVPKSKDERVTAVKTGKIGLWENKKPANLYLYIMKVEQVRAASHILKNTHRIISDLAASGILPLRLYVQVEDCKTENRNGYMF